MAKILFVETNPIGLDVILEAKKLGYYVIFITSDLKYYLRGNTLDKHPLGKVDEIAEISSTYNTQVLINFIENNVSYKEIDAIITLNEMHSNVVAHLAEHFGVAGLNPQSADIARNKYLTRKLLSKFCIPSPNYQYAQTLDEIINVSESIGYPIIIKPINGTGSLYVKVNHSKEEVIQHYEMSEKATSFSRSVPKKDGYLVEKFIEGDLISVETVSCNGHHKIIGITKRELEGYPYFIEVGSIFPSEIFQAKEIEMLTNKILDCLNFNFGFSHIEFILSANGPVFIEINPRLAGGVIPKLIELSYDINISSYLLNLYLQKSSNFIFEPRKIAGSYHFTSPQKGFLSQVIGWDEITNGRLVQKALLNKNIGHKLNGLKSNFDRLGYVIIEGDSEKEVINEILRIKNLFSIKVNQKNYNY